MYSYKPTQRILHLCLAIILALSIAICTVAPAFAAPTKDMMVTDNAGMLTSEQESEIEDTLYDINQQTGIEFAVYTIESLDGQDIETKANDLFRELGLGDFEKNNGLLLLIALNDRKFRLEVGYGLEGTIPDTKAAEIINTMTPYFKENNYADGIKVAVANTVSTLNNSGDYTINFDWDKIQELTKGSELTEGKKKFYNILLKVDNCGNIGIIIFGIAALGWQVLLILNELIFNPIWQFLHQRWEDGKFRPLFEKKRQQKLKQKQEWENMLRRSKERDEQWEKKRSEAMKNLYAPLRMSTGHDIHWNEEIRKPEPPKHSSSSSGYESSGSSSSGGSWGGGSSGGSWGGGSSGGGGASGGW